MKNLQTAAPALPHRESKRENRGYDLVVFCHLRWDFVYQRPQHIISRLSNDMKILFVEEPIGFSPEEEHSAKLTEISETLHILQPKVRNIEAIGAMLSDFLDSEKISVGWFYSAAFSPVIDALEFGTIVYDCMDELSLFKGAPQALIDQEKFLIGRADVVFTGGKSLYDSKKSLHQNVFCFPSSVDQPHFAQALNGILVPEDIASIAHPIVGYFGVIDERIDLELIAKTASENQNVSFVMIGPIAKIDENELPKARNIQYLGIKSYSELPNYLKAFDIAMMPFALNDATKFISPTKTLEYMAAGKPIVSTRIADVVRDYSEVVELIESEADFTSAIARIRLSADAKNPSDYSKILEKTSWDATVSAMKIHLKQLAS
ncbi:glycosyltransferase [Flavobacterium sp.]|uniref:glycosyltransferase n=1 Tax=Flavobacterium sp. TaxID=239 RepID=UPI00121D27B6|nr:glycosyltransferase [Flavobacterium sp.]RZJ70614.1 MAG: glycosyltransferase family 1 protein [Flavobacterium sp.]